MTKTINISYHFFLFSFIIFYILCDICTNLVSFYWWSPSYHFSSFPIICLSTFFCLSFFWSSFTFFSFSRLRFHYYSCLFFNFSLFSFLFLSAWRISTSSFRQPLVYFLISAMFFTTVLYGVFQWGNYIRYGQFFYT